VLKNGIRKDTAVSIDLLEKSPLALKTPEKEIAGTLPRVIL
jgi:hypothetical protein